MILIDTSIWVEFFRKNSAIIISKEMISGIATCPPVVQEVLQGIRDDANYARIHRAMVNFSIIGEPLETDRYVEAAHHSNVSPTATDQGLIAGASNVALT